jgi:glycosyltransferase involved in cell wall biosynthesis
MTSVAIVINNFNYGSYIREAIESALNQDLPAHRVIVVDDGSTDDSWDVITSFGSDITAIRQRNTGQLSAIERGVQEAKSSDVVALLDADDIASPKRVRALADAYAAFPAAGWVFHDLIHSATPASSLLSADGQLAYGSIDERNAIRRGRSSYVAPATSGLSFRSHVIASWRPYPVSRGIWISDNYLKFLAQAYAPGVHIPQPLGVLRIHGRNRYTSSQDNSVMRNGISLATAHALLTHHPQLKQQAYSLLKRSWAEQDSHRDLCEIRDDLRRMLPWHLRTWFQVRPYLSGLKQTLPTADRIR